MFIMQKERGLRFGVLEFGVYGWQGLSDRNSWLPKVQVVGNKVSESRSPEPQTLQDVASGFTGFSAYRLQAQKEGQCEERSFPCWIEAGARM